MSVDPAMLRQVAEALFPIVAAGSLAEVGALATDEARFAAAGLLRRLRQRLAGQRPLSDLRFDEFVLELKALCDGNAEAEADLRLLGSQRNVVIGSAHDVVVNQVDAKDSTFIGTVFGFSESSGDHGTNT